MVDIKNYVRDTSELKYYIVDEDNFEIHLTEVSKDEALDHIVEIMTTEQLPPERRRRYGELEDRIKFQGRRR